MTKAAALAKAFCPTAEQIEAAQAVFLGMAWLGTVKPVVDAYQRAILAEHQWPMARRWIERENGRGLAPKVITEPRDSYLIEDEAFLDYERLCKEARENAKLTVRNPENCPKLEAESDLIKAENAFIKLTAMPVARIDPDMIFSASLENRKKYIDLTLSLFAPFIKRIEK